jgi:hypothetical protein
MNDEPRLREGDGDPELRALLRARPALVELPAEVRARSRERVRALSALPVAAGLLTWVQHAALGAALGVVVVAAAQAPRLLSRTKPELSQQAPAAPVEVAKTKAASVAAAAPTAAPVAETPEATPAQVPVAAFSAPEKSSLDAELALLHRAKHALARDPAAALGTLERHRTEFVGSSLWAEREILAITALVRLGRRGEAEGRAESLRRRIPGSLYATRLDGILNERR